MSIPRGALRQHASACNPFMNPDTAPVVDRMARLIRARNLDLLNLMDDFLKRPRGSRMPIRNRAFLDVSTFGARCATRLATNGRGST